MNIRPYLLPRDEAYPELPEVEPMESADDLAALIDEFCARHASRPEIASLSEEVGQGVIFALGEEPDSAMFAFELSCRNVRFISGVEFSPAPEHGETVRELFVKLASGATFGELKITVDGAHWEWIAPALRYPYFHGIAMHAIAYAEYLADKLWPVVRDVAAGKLTVPEACERVQTVDAQPEHGGTI